MCVGGVREREKKTEKKRQTEKKKRIETEKNYKKNDAIIFFLTIAE